MDLPENLSELSDEALKALAVQILQFQVDDIKENALYYYQPVSETARQIHLSTVKTLGIGGGNGSSKTETALVELLILATGIIPKSLENYPRVKLRGPVNTRIILESLTTVLHPIFLPKMQWWKWSGVDSPGQRRGHWGWIPRTSLKGGKWDTAWSEKNRLLTLLYRDPDNPEAVLGESTIQFMSHDQDPTDFASGDLHFVLMDEVPRFSIWRENQARTMRVNGRMMLAMTWPDEPAIPVDWIFDEVYDKAKGLDKDPNVEWFELFTTDNPNLDQTAVAQQMAQWSDVIKKVRIYGQPIRFSNRIHPLFNDIRQTWCFHCGADVVVQDKVCSTCHSEDVTSYNHVQDFDVSETLPVIYVVDPHPRKPHMMLWVQVDTFDDLWVVAESEVNGDTVDVKTEVDRIEQTYKLKTAQRLIDPNMGASPSGARRGVTWNDEFRSANLVLDPADDSDVGRKRINTYLKPDKQRLQPRLHVHSRCRQTIHQLKRYVWDEFRASAEKDLKQRPKEKYDDYPTMLKYVLNTDPQFTFLARGAPILRRGRH